jgi:hypothetical protein
MQRAFSFVSGHDFSRAIPGQNGPGFSACRPKICTQFQEQKAQGLKSLRENGKETVDLSAPVEMPIHLGNDT